MTQVRLSTEVYNRPAKDGSPRFQARFFADGIANPIMVKSLGKQFINKGQANREAGRLLATLQPDLLRLYDSKLSGLAKEQKVEDSFRQLPFGQFVVDFWTAGKSDYIESLASAGTPLSGMYIANRLSKATEYVLPYPPFNRPLSKVGLLLVEQFFRSLRSAGVEDNLFEPIKKTLQKPISYAIERGLIDVPFEMKGAKIPKPKYEKRGILTAEQVVSIFAVPTVPLRIIPTKGGDQLYHDKRPRLKKGATHVDLAPLDLREKAFVYASLKSGLRRGELRALRWEHLELGERPAIHVKENFVPVDGTKGPKYGSARSVAMSVDLQILLKLLKTEADQIGFGSPNDYVFFNSRPGVPISAGTVTRAFQRVLTYAGIDEATRKNLNIVLHSGRHYFSHLVANSVGAATAMNATGHRNFETFARYALHQTDEDMEKLRVALNITLLPPSPSETR